MTSRREAKILHGNSSGAQRGGKPRRSVVDKSVPFEERGQILRDIARSRWLTNEELVDVLTHHKEFGFPISKEAPREPPSGSVFLYDRSQTKKFKDDGVNWLKKKGQNRVREDFVKLHIRGVPAITGFYAHCQDNSSFHRRAYRLSNGGEYFFVHYLDESTLEEYDNVHFISRSHSSRSTAENATAQDNWPAADRWTDSSSNGCGTTVEPMSMDGSSNFLQLGADPLAAFSSTDQSLDWQSGGQDQWQASKGLFGQGFIDGCVENTLEYDQLLEDGLDCFREGEDYLGMETYCRRGTQFPNPTIGVPYGAFPVSGQADTGNVTPLLTITDFSPARDKCVGGCKVLICLSADLPVEYQHSNTLQVAFGEQCVPAVCVSSSVLRCLTPPHPVGAVRLSVRTQHGHNITTPTEDKFEFRVGQQHQPEAPRMLRLISRSSSESNPQDTSISMSVPNQFYGEHLNKSSVHLRKRRSDSLDLVSNDHHSAVPHDTDREYKIRIVEKLQDTMKRTPRTGGLSHHVPPTMSIDTSVAVPTITDPARAARYAESHTPSAGGSIVDDQKLAALTDEELAYTLEKLLVRTVGQLVQLADDGHLRDELHALDKSGYSLLHYCCLYNMGPLLPILLSKGVNVNHRSGCGSTPLHLAAATGSLSIVQSLLENGADVESLDASGCKPADRAFLAGHNDVCGAILKAGGHLTTPGVPSLDLHSNNQSGTVPMKIQCDRPEMLSLQRRRTASDAMIPGLYNALSPVGLSDDRQADDANSSLLQSAFNSLSLHDKCALSLSLSNKPVSFLQNGRYRSISVETKDDDVDVASVITDTDKESLDVAMALMSPAELVELEGEARVIQNNVRAWLLRRNYKNLRDAAKIVQHAWRERKRHESPEKQRGCGEIQSESSLQEAKKATTLLGRQKFDFLRQQAMDSLIIQKNLCRPSLSDLSPKGGGPDEV